MDLEDLGSKLGLDIDEFRVLAKMFVEKAVIDIKQYRKSCIESDGETAAGSAHSLKGSSANLGFSEIHDLARKAEADSKTRMTLFLFP